MKIKQSIIAMIILGLFSAFPALAQDTSLSFFVTSVGSGKGGNLGGLAGADAHCKALAEKVGAGDKNWRAYLSSQGPNAVNARDRIGRGPWYNANGRLVGQNVDELHSYATRMSMREAVAENGAIIPGGGYAPNRHDILTGSKPDGTAYPAGDDMTCNNWTSSGAGKAMVGHHDRAAWGSAHPSRGPDGGCSQSDLRGTGGDGLFYCFVAN
jgi:hypothetical protein